MKFAYFGSSEVSIYVLDELIQAGYVPHVVVTTPDKPQGRGLVMTPNIVKTWATDKGIKVYSPAKLDAAFAEILRAENCDLFIVASYGKIMPARIVNMPPRKTLNMHPSLLPRYRGAAPLPTTILEDAKKTGVTIMRMDEEMDHGPIVAIREVEIEEWPAYEVFEEMMAREGGRLLAQILPDWVAGQMPEIPQNHFEATYTKKLQKEDALIDMKADPYVNFRKIQAYHGWPTAYFFVEKDDRKIRVKITRASFGAGKLKIETVIPEGKREMSYSSFLNGYALNPG